MASDDVVKIIEHNLLHLHPYGSWTIGRTTDPVRRERELDFPGFWRFWDAEDPNAAKQVEEHFLGRGMRKDDQEEDRATVVYLF